MKYAPYAPLFVLAALFAVLVGCVESSPDRPMPKEHAWEYMEPPVGSPFKMCARRFASVDTPVCW